MVSRHKREKLPDTALSIDSNGIEWEEVRRPPEQQEALWVGLRSQAGLFL